MTVCELEERMTSLEFSEWLAFDRIEYEDQERARQAAKNSR